MTLHTDQVAMWMPGAVDPLLVYGASGSTSAPAAQFDGALVFGVFGVGPQMLIPAGTVRPGRSWIRLSVSHRKIGPANASLQILIGPAGAPGDPIAISSQISNSGQTPVAGLLTAHIAITPTGTHTVYSHNRGIVGGDNAEHALTATIDWTLDQALSLGIVNSASGTAHQIIQYTFEVFTQSMQGGFVEAVEAPIAVPAAFLGLVSQDWPALGQAPALAPRSLSVSDNRRTHWRNLHTAPGVIDWTTLDTVVAGARAAGIDHGLYLLYACPTWLASTGAAQVGPYGGLGEGAMPADLSALAAFCTAFAERNLAQWGAFFRLVQLFNEPESGAFSGVASSTSYWWGTAAQYVDMLATAYAALHAADSTLTVLTPGTGSVATMATWLAATGPVTGKQGRECFDAVAIHPYHATPNPTYTGRGDVYGLASCGVRNIRAALTVAGRGGVDLYATEYGFYSPVTPAAVTAFLALPAADRRKRMARTLLSMARHGIKGVYVFSSGNVDNLSGQLGADAAGVDAGFADGAAVCSKTIARGGWFSDGRECIEFSDGSSVEL